MFVFLFGSIALFHHTHCYKVLPYIYIYTYKFESNLSAYILSESVEIRLTSVSEQDDSVSEQDDSVSEFVLRFITTDPSKIFSLHWFLLSLGVEGSELWQEKNTITLS